MVAAALDMIASVKDPNHLVKFFRPDAAAQEAITQFAQANNMTYTVCDQSLFNFPTDFDAYKTRPAWAGFLAGTSNCLATHVVSGELYGFPVTMFMARQVFGDNHVGGAQVGEMLLTSKSVIRVRLSKVFPQLVLDSNKNDRGTSSSIEISFNQDQRQSLEGDFDGYFDFFVPRGLQINSLTVLAPNFMRIIMGSSAVFDVEFFGDEMVLISNDPLYTEDVMRSLDAALKEQLTYMSRLLNSWNYTPRTAPFDLLERSFVGGSVVKVGGVRVTPKWMLIGVAALFGLALLVFFVAWVGSLFAL
jgi:hypothetical protein